MKIFVCIKQVPDTEAKIKINSSSTGIDATGIKWVMNPYDEFAVEEALKLKEQGKVANVTLLTVGPKARTIEALRTGLAMGADDAISIDCTEEIDSYSTSKALAAAIKNEGEFKFVFTGKLAIDDNAASVGQMIAEFLQIPHATVISKLDWADARALAEREIEGGTREVLDLSVPALVAANKGLNNPRYASLPGIMKAKKKPVKELSIADLGVTGNDVRVRFINYALPAEKPAVKMLSGGAAEQANELVRLLHNEAKVL